MKFIHKLKAAWLTRQLMRQRVENIESIRAGRNAVRILRIKLAREKRLAGNHTPQGKALPAAASRSETGAGNLSQVIKHIRFERA